MNNKKAFLFTAVLFVVLTAGVYAQQQQQYDPETDFEVNINDNEIIITEYLGAKKEVRIPPVIQDLPVTIIGAMAFYEKGNITRVILPKGVTKIEYNAFFNCTNLTGVTIPDTVTIIEPYAFIWSGITTVTIPKSVVYIGGGAFGGCTRLTAINVAADNKEYSSMGGVLYDKNKTYLHTYPAGKTDSSNFVIPGTLLSIGDYAFTGCSRIVSIGIPASVKYIGVAAFLNCSRLSRLTVAADNTAYLTENNVLYNKDKTLLHTYPAGRAGSSFTIQACVKTIGDMAFAACENLKSITFEGTIRNGEFDIDAFRRLGDLRDKFYETDKTNGTPGTYTRESWGQVWTLTKEK